jgi:peptidyl-tRNA hydrolase
MKTTKSIGFPNQNENKGNPSSKFKLWNNKNKNKIMTCAKQKSNKILLQGKKKKVRLWEENIPKIGVEQIESN